jgi:hypothetical protein
MELSFALSRGPGTAIPRWPSYLRKRIFRLKVHPISELAYNRQQIMLISYGGHKYGPLYANPEARPHFEAMFVSFINVEDWRAAEEDRHKAEIRSDSVYRNDVASLEAKIRMQDTVIKRMQATMSKMAENWLKMKSGTLSCPFESSYPDDTDVETPCSACGVFGDDPEAVSLHCVG